MILNKRPRLMVGLTIGFVAVLGGIFYYGFYNASAHMEGWVVTAPVQPGAVLTPSDLKQVAVPATGGQFQVLTQDPSGRRVTVALQPGDLLTSSLLDPSTTAEVPLSVHMAPNLSPGSTIDIYADVNGQTEILGRGMVVASTNPLTILVPDQDEPLWISVAGSSTTLIVADSSGIGVPSSNVSVLQSIQALDVVSGGSGAAPGASATPAASPATSSGQGG